MDVRIWSWLKIGVVALLVIADAVLLALVIGRNPTAGGAPAKSAQQGRVASAPSTSHSQQRWVASTPSTSHSQQRWVASTPSTSHSQQGWVASTPSSSRSPKSNQVTATTLPNMVEDALVATTWPPLQTLDRTAAWSSTTCMGTDEQTLQDCTFGPSHADHVAVVLGDDVAVSWLPGIRAALEPHGWQVQALTYQDCPASTIWVMAPGSKPDYKGDALTAACADHQEWALTRVEQIKPDLVIFASGENTLNRLATGAHGLDAQHLWQIAVTDTVNRVRKAAGQTVVLSPPPEGTDISRCDTAGPPAQCSFGISATWKSMSRADEAAAAATGAAYVDTSRWFCDEAGRCPAFVDGTIVRADGVHLTTDYSRRLAPLLAGALLGSQG